MVSEMEMPDAEFNSMTISPVTESLRRVVHVRYNRESSTLTILSKNTDNEPVMITYRIFEKQLYINHCTMDSSSPLLTSMLTSLNKRFEDAATNKNLFFLKCWILILSTSCLTMRLQFTPNFHILTSSSYDYFRDYRCT